MYDVTGVSEVEKSFSVTLESEIGLIFTNVFAENLPKVKFHTLNQQLQKVKYSRSNTWQLFNIVCLNISPNFEKLNKVISCPVEQNSYK